jgi:hypothetical protein
VIRVISLQGVKRVWVLLTTVWATGETEIKGPFSNLGLKRAATLMVGSPSLGRNPNSWTAIEPYEGQSPRRISDPEFNSPESPRAGRTGHLTNYSRLSHALKAEDVGLMRHKGEIISQDLKISRKFEEQGGLDKVNSILLTT